MGQGKPKKTCEFKCPMPLSETYRIITELLLDAISLQQNVVLIYLYTSF